MRRRTLQGGLMGSGPHPQEGPQQTSLTEDAALSDLIQPGRRARSSRSRCSSHSAWSIWAGTCAGPGESRTSSKPSWAPLCGQPAPPVDHPVPPGGPPADRPRSPRRPAPGQPSSPQLVGHLFDRQPARPTDSAGGLSRAMVRTVAARSTAIVTERGSAAPLPRGVGSSGYTTVQKDAPA